MPVRPPAARNPGDTVKLLAIAAAALAGGHIPPDLAGACQTAYRHATPRRGNGSAKVRRDAAKRRNQARNRRQQRG